MKIIHFADLHLGVEAYGHLEAETGLSSRFRDLLCSFDQLVDYAIKEKADLVLFCGDAYKSRDPSQTQQREFARRIKRLSQAGIPVFLLVGNHDLPSAMGRATTTEIFNTLAVDNVWVASKPEVVCVETKHGPVQVAALPWLKRSNLIAKEESKNLSLEQLNQRMQELLTQVVDNLAKKVDPAVPAILAAHLWVQGARLGSESGMSIGQEHTILPSTAANPVFDYVALGHIHRHQVLVKRPPVVYAGSLDRLDFGDEDDEKGFFVIDITPGKEKREVRCEFRPVAARRFLTIELRLEPGDADPTATVLRALAARAEELQGSIVRLELTLPPGLTGQLNDNEIRKAAAGASYFALAKRVERVTRTRLGDTLTRSITPAEALEAYLKLKTEGQPTAPLAELLACGRQIIQGEAGEEH